MNARNVVDESRHEWDYILEKVDNYAIVRDGGKIYPTHQLTFKRDPEGMFNKERYMVNVSGSEIELVSHEVGSGNRYNAHQMFSLRFRAILEDAGYTVVDGAENIDLETVEKVRSWLKTHGVDPEAVDVDVNEKHLSVTISTTSYLDGDDWETFISVMRSRPEINFARSQSVHYVDDEDVPSLLDGGEHEN